MDVVSRIANAIGNVGRTLHAAPHIDAEVLAAAARGPARLPGFTAGGFLPAGIHDATIGELAVRLGTNGRRLSMLEHFNVVLGRLRSEGYEAAYVGGSFVTRKARPGDLDVLFLKPGRNGLPSQSPSLDLQRLAGNRGIHLYPADGMPDVPPLPSGRHETYLEFMQHNRALESVGIVRIPLR